MRYGLSSPYNQMHQIFKTSLSSTDFLPLEKPANMVAGGLEICVLTRAPHNCDELGWRRLERAKYMVK